MDKFKELTFPSPCGVNIVANGLLLLQRVVRIGDGRFPSPCGVNIVANSFVGYELNKIPKGFRPLAG